MTDEKEKVSSIKDGVFTNFVELQDIEAKVALNFAFTSFIELSLMHSCNESLGSVALDYLRSCDIRLIMPIEAYNKALEESKNE